MSASFNKLRSKLAELFQLDAAAELDFGIYRILNARRVEIAEFLDSLEGQVDANLAEALGSGSGATKAELDKTIADLRALSVDETAIAANKKVIALREKLAAAGSDPTALSQEIFSHLATFFSRYYQDGDFISLRRYKKDTYAIPYEGEEVKLHWANADQYYIKSSETLRDYAFRLGPAPKSDKPDTRPTVTFKLVEADTEKNNAKAVAGQERRFVFQGVFPTDAKDHLILGFAYLPLGKGEKQTALNEAAAKAILTEHAKGTFTDLAAKDPTYTGSQKGGRTILSKHLTEYTGRNTFDYFVHKDLGGFLRRELDFYVKNEVLHLDDLDEAPEANWTETRAKLKALRSIAAKVIHFLAQLEDFQKKLWLKKKFVTACDYVVTLDRIPEEMYPEIAACDAQREEWVRLFSIDEIKGDLGRTGYSKPLRLEFLKENQILPIDTRNLPGDLSRRIAINFSQIDGLVFDSENFQAIRTAANRYRDSLPCIYIDPPYNTGGDGFAYKDQFQHSSWGSFLLDRIATARWLLSPNDGSIFASIDDGEQAFLRDLMGIAFGADNFVANIIWQKKYAPANDATWLSDDHDFLVGYARNKPKWTPGRLPRDATNNKAYSNPDGDERGDWRADNYKCNKSADERPNLYYAITNPTTGEEIWPQRNAVWRYNKETHEKNEANGVVWWGKDGTNGTPAYKRFLTDVGELVTRTIWKYDEVGHNQDGIRQLRALIPETVFTSPKPTGLIERVVRVGNAGTVLDFFAGSGTTGHAVINLNREDGGDRKYILIEMGEHFNTVLIPRLKKVIYSSEWKDGKPQNRNTGISHCIKILRLESYEDTLNNLRLHRSRAQELALEAMSPEAREQYQLGYMLDLEARGSQSLLNISAFTDPWNYSLEIASGSAGETKTTKVDLVETFNWLLGLTVLAQGGGPDKKSGGVVWVEGTNPEGEKVLVLWRNTSEVDADALNAWCKKQKVKVQDGEFALIYVNGDHHLENLRREDQPWKVRLTDEEFPKHMWEGCE